MLTVDRMLAEGVRVEPKVLTAYGLPFQLVKDEDAPVDDRGKAKFCAFHMRDGMSRSSNEFIKSMNSR